MEIEYTEKQRQVLIKLIQAWCDEETLNRLSIDQLLLIRDTFEQFPRILDREEVCDLLCEWSYTEEKAQDICDALSMTTVLWGNMCVDLDDELHVLPDD